MTKFDEPKKSFHRMANTPGKFHFKVKSYDNEEGEYSAWELEEPGTIIQFIMRHWFNETLPNNLDIIVIKNDKGDQLVIDHENKDVFRFFLIPAEKGLYYYYKMTDIRFMFFTLEHFFSGLLDILRENLNRTMDDFRWVKGDFLKKNFHFTISRWRFFTYFFFPILFGVGLLVCTLLMLLFDLQGLGLFIIVIPIGAAFYIVDTVRRVKWYLDQRVLGVQLSRGDRYIHVWLNEQKKSIPKADIISIHQHFSRDRDGDFWIPRYTQIDFTNGDTLNLNELLIPQEPIQDKFHQERRIFQIVHSDKKGIQKKTSLAGYFPLSLRTRYSR
jgi:hypothetical protein